jgi:hypothetical protein
LIRLPAPERGGIYDQNPQLADAEKGNLHMGNGALHEAGVRPLSR